MSYFDTSGEGAAGLPRIVTAADLRTVPLADGIAAKPVMGERLNMSVATLDGGAVAALHNHVEEQIGYIVKGACEFTDGTTTWTLGPGDCYHCPSNAPHGVRALGGGCLIVDVFSPPRAGIKELLGDD